MLNFKWAEPLRFLAQGGRNATQLSKPDRQRFKKKNPKKGTYGYRLDYMKDRNVDENVYLNDTQRFTVAYRVLFDKLLVYLMPRLKK